MKYVSKPELVVSNTVDLLVQFHVTSTGVAVLAQTCNIANEILPVAHDF